MLTSKIEIHHEKTKYHSYKIVAPYSLDLVEFCRTLKTNYGWKMFSFSDGAWRFSNILFIAEFKKRFPDINLTRELESKLSEAEEKLKEEKVIESLADEIKQKKDTEFRPKGLKKELYPYQNVSVEFLLNNNGIGMITHSMGLGKTVCALGYLAHTKKLPALVVCPASVKGSWRNEVIKWTRLKPSIISSKSNPVEFFEDADIYIINYDLLRRFSPVLLKIKFACVIFDEFTYIKNPSAHRSKSAKLIAKGILSKILLSGTPVLSRPAELFNPLSIVDPLTWNSYYAFARRYCGMRQTPWGLDVSGATNIEELKEKISKYFIRFTKEEVLSDLPEKMPPIIMPVEFSAEIEKEYALANANVIRYLKEVRSYPPEKLRMMNVAAEKLVQIGYLRQICVNGKIAAAKELIQSIVDSGEKCLVFSSYNKPLEELVMGFGGGVMITGKTESAKRQEIVDRFQNDKNVNVFFGGYKSAGVGITLTAATNVVLLDLPWNPADMEQAIDRAHRIGNKASSLNIYKLLVPETIDEMMQETLKEKQKIFDALIGGKGTDTYDNSEFIKDLEDKIIGSESIQKYAKYI